MDDADNAWIFDSLVCFLNGPIWNAPLQTFIEEKSLIFEPNAVDNDDYKSIFEEYKNLVDLMLSGYMEDIGISPEQFENACNKGHLGLLPHFQHNLFEQIWAANDFELFKQMMIQRNVELQLQALELIEQKYGITPQIFVPNSDNKKSDTKKESQENASKSEINLEENVMEEVIKTFPFENKNEDVAQGQSNADDEVQYLLEEKHLLQQQLKSIEKTASKLTSNQSEKKEQKKEDASTTKVPEKVIETKATTTKIDEVELKRRQEYLRAQRDKLVALKKEARKKQFNNNNLIDNSKSRPKSAKIAEAVLTGNPTNLDSQQLQIRKALAERLRSEVIGEKSDN